MRILDTCCGLILALVYLSLNGCGLGLQKWRSKCNGHVSPPSLVEGTGFFSNCNAEHPSLHSRATPGRAGQQTSPNTCPSTGAPLPILHSLLFLIISLSNAHHHFSKTFSPIS